MQKELVQSEAKRLLLEKCLRGEVALDEASHVQTGDAKPQPASSVRSEPESQQYQASIPSSTNDRTKPQPAIQARSNRRSLVETSFQQVSASSLPFRPRREDAAAVPPSHERGKNWQERLDRR